MVRHDGTPYQPMIFHDGTTFTAGSIFVRPSTYFGTAKLDRLIFKATGNTSGTFVIRVNGQTLTPSLNVPSATAGQTREFVFMPSHFTNGKVPELRNNDILVIDFANSPANFYVGVVFK